ncbi:Trypanosome variant surface glycoprotein C-terminal domain containing protein [Trypanosoma brucei equiperdum]|uniref:Trypanosome variant surface glycoprotein C-terminal domain containing protein n=1 Tax=Trypanosoma brucei equiperdum TaxID=630700 RepID=A0A3L6LDA7_9TRYP|nr:Trypanosome variant surface glycoprotein C-terminal domain containing protein [Trypanosoma brucei equiperdum]
MQLKAVAQLFICFHAIVIAGSRTKESLPAAGLNLACGIAKTLREIGHFATTMASKIPEEETKLKVTAINLKLMFKKGLIEPTDDNLNAYMYISSQIDKSQQALGGHLPGFIKASLSAAMLAEQISETTEMFFKARTNTGAGQSYCMAEDHNTAKHATASHIPNCVAGEDVRLNHGDAEVTAAPDLTSLTAEVPGKGSAATLGANSNGNCHLSATMQSHRILNHANGNEATLYLAGGLLKIAGTAYDNNAWSTQHDKQPNSAITETRSRYATVTSALPNTLDTLKKLAKLGEDTDPQIEDTKVQSTDLGLSGEAKEITIKKTVFSNLHKELKQFLTETQTEKNKERQTVARDMLVKALAKPSEPIKCNTSVTDDVCYAIKEETACNATAACSYNKTETDSNKKCKVDAEKPKKKSVSATQPQTTETTTDKCKDKKKDECKSPDCKWEGETCKDPSFLLKTEFAVITAVFIS